MCFQEREGSGEREREREERETQRDEGRVIYIYIYIKSKRGAREILSPSLPGERKRLWGNGGEELPLLLGREREGKTEERQRGALTLAVKGKGGRGKLLGRERGREEGGTTSTERLRLCIIPRIGMKSSMSAAATAAAESPSSSFPTHSASCARRPGSLSGGPASEAAPRWTGPAKAPPVRDPPPPGPYPSPPRTPPAALAGKKTTLIPPPPLSVCPASESDRPPVCLSLSLAPTPATDSDGAVIGAVIGAVMDAFIDSIHH